MKFESKLILICLLGVVLLPVDTGRTQSVTHIAESFHSLFLERDGSLWGTGHNSNGQLGDGTYSDVNLPERIEANSVSAIAAGALHSLYLKSDGSLWAMGYNQSGQLGDGSYNDTNRPEMILASNVTAIAAGDFRFLDVCNG